MILISRTRSALDGDSNTNSPAQLEHLRYQMMSILHTLSSTFTTCACGAKATDCALSQMAAFVDGELPKDSGEGSVDLGPLVGSIRGFRTREKVPMSGGMSGVEMDIESDEPVAGPSTIRHERRHTVDNVAYAFRSSDEQYHHSNHESPGARRISLPTLTFSPATASPSPKKIKSWKGKERATSNSRTQEEGDDEEDSFSSRGSQGFMSRCCLLFINFSTLTCFTSRNWPGREKPSSSARHDQLLCFVTCSSVRRWRGHADNRRGRQDASKDAETMDSAELRDSERHHATESCVAGKRCESREFEQ